MRADIERRSIPAVIEVRADAKDPKKKKLVGYAALFNSLSEDLGGFREVIRPGAFDRALAENQDVLARAEHDSSMLLGRRSNGTLTLSIDATGLRYEVDPPDTQAGRDTLVLVERGDVKQSSFAFRVPSKDGEVWGVAPEGDVLRELVDLDLVDVAPVADPAYRQTMVSVRSMEMAKAVKVEADRRFLTLFRSLTEEQREASYEDKLQAIYAGLCKLLGEPYWEGPRWYVEATFDDRVVVETFEGSRRYTLYSLSFDGKGVPTFGAPVEVEKQYVPVVPPAATDDVATRDDEAPTDVYRQRLQLLERQ